MKFLKSAVGLILCCASISNAADKPKYVYKTNFGVADLTQMKVFNSKKSLETYLHSFGYLSSYLTLISSSKYPGSDTIILEYGIKDGSVEFKGNVRPNALYGDSVYLYHKQHQGLYQSPQAYIKNQFSCGKDCHITSIKPDGDWTYDQSQMILDKNYKDFDSKFDYIYHRQFTITYSGSAPASRSPGDDKTVTDTASFTVYKYAELDCTPPEADNFGDYIQYIPHDYGFYKPEKNKHDGSCVYNNISALTAGVTAIPAPPADEKQSCKVSADPIDVVSGKLHESVTDLVVSSANPIYIKRYYSRDGSLWHFSYTRRLEVNDADKIILVRDNGDKYKFAKVGDKLVPENGLHAMLTVKDGDQIHL